MYKPSDSVNRIREINTQRSGACERTSPPAQTVAHGMVVEARLVQAIAARRKKERTAGGASAADLAESILAGGLPSRISSAVDTDGDHEPEKTATSPDDDWLNADTFSQSAQPDFLFDEGVRHEPISENDSLSELFGGGSNLQHQVDQQTIAVVHSEKTENGPSANRHRLQHILDQISGKT